jgi:hypothetical protein
MGGMEMATRFTAKDEQQPDWSNYDFRVWDPGNVPGSPAASFTGTVLRSIIASPDWPTNLASGVSLLKKALVPTLNSYTESLQRNLDSLDSNLAAATGAAQMQMQALQESLRSSATPPQPRTDPSSYLVAAKVVDRESKVGLPGITVSVVNDRNPSISLASATTDLAGNAILRLKEGQISEAASTLVLKAVSSQGKELFSSQLCPKIDHTDTVVAPIAIGSELAQQLDLANVVLGRQQSLIATINTHVDAMKTGVAQAKNDLQQELKQVQAMIEDLN